MIVALLRFLIMSHIPQLYTYFCYVGVITPTGFLSQYFVGGIFYAVQVM